MRVPPKHMPSVVHLSDQLLCTFSHCHALAQRCACTCQCPCAHLQFLYAVICTPRSAGCPCTYRVHAHTVSMHPDANIWTTDLMKMPMPMHTPCPCAHLQDLYAKICGVSYIGDVRMGFAEDSRKIERIASGSAEGLALMYNKRLQVGPCSCRRTAHNATFVPTQHTASCVWLAAHVF